MNKKIIAILICGAMALSLAACGDSSEEIKQPDEIDAEGTDLFKGFIALTEEIGTMTYEEADEYVKSLGYPLSVENEETGGIITENDENGFHLTVNTYEDDSGKETIYSTGYLCNGVYEVSADDYFHDYDTPTYYTYNANASTPLQTVDSIDDMITFINDEVPELIAEYGDPYAEPEEEVAEEEEPQVTDEMIAEEASFMENLQAENEDWYNSYLYLMNLLSYYNAGFNAMEDSGEYDIHITGKDGGTETDYYKIEEDLFGMDGYYEIWVSEDDGSILGVSYIPDQEHRDSTQRLHLFNDWETRLDKIFGDHEKEYESGDIEDSWLTDIHVASFVLGRFDSGNENKYNIELTILPNADYEYINPDYHKK